MKLFRLYKALTAAGLLALLSSATPSLAQETAADLLVMLERGGHDRDIGLALVHAYTDGYGWANAEIKGKGQPALFCQPDKLAITGAQATDILRRFLAEDPDSGNYPMGMIMLKALQDALPC